MPPRRYPDHCIVALHGRGEYASDGIRHTRGGLANAIRQAPNAFRPTSCFRSWPSAITLVAVAKEVFQKE